MFNEELAQQILERLDHEFPTTMTVAQLRTELPSFSNQARDEWFDAVDALRMQGLVDCKLLRSGTGEIDDIGPITITARGKSTLRKAPNSLKSGVFYKSYRRRKSCGASG